MKKLFSLMILSALIVCGASAATAPRTVDMADYGTSLTITNAAASSTMGTVLITYDAASTNTIYFDVILADGITYRIGSDSVSNEVYSDALTLIPVTLKDGEKWKISTTITNVNLNITYK